MIIFRDNNIGKLYPEIINTIINKGIEISPRGQKTLELPEPVCIEIPPANRKTFFVDTIRCIPPKFIYFELLWILSQRNDLYPLASVNKNMTKYSDDGETLYGAYGKRMGYQINCVIDKLIDDLHTRQAVIVIIRPEDTSVKTKDFPCNNLLQFRVRNNYLNLTIYVRSQDIWTGFPIDIVHWNILQYIFCSILSLKPGTIYNVVNSLHLYDRNKEEAFKLLSNKENLDFAVYNSFNFIPQIFKGISLQKFRTLTSAIKEYPSEEFRLLCEFYYEQEKNSNKLLEIAENAWRKKWRK